MDQALGSYICKHYKVTIDSLNSFLVGGAVRDKLLGLEVKDRDWVVVGSTPEQMIQLGFKAVGADFPVFLHPDTSEEYALARTERKIGSGYQGFSCDSSSGITLEEDLLRRDLTINAMAETKNGELIDPYGGKQDLHNKLLKHVSPAFSEDPLRVLRLARFAARFKSYGFTVADETIHLCIKIRQSGELSHLKAERVWQETQRALSEPHPELYFEILRKIDALAILFPELDRLFGVPQPEQHHPEIDCGVHALLSLTQACLISADPEVRFAALIHDLGKGLTAETEWPKHHGHEKQGVKLVNRLCERLNTPKSFRDLARLTSEFHTHIHRAESLRATTVLKVLKSCDAFRKPQRFEKLLLASEADAKGRTGFEQTAYPQADLFRNCLEAAKSVNPKPFVEQGLRAEALGQAIDRARVAAIKKIIGQEHDA